MRSDSRNLEDPGAVLLTEHFKNSIDASVVRGISSYQVKAPSHTTPPLRSQWSWALKSAPRASAHPLASPKPCRLLRRPVSAPGCTTWRTALIAV